MTAAVPAGHASVVVQRRVEWPDTDAAGHYHHATVIRWVEAAEAVLYDRLGLSGLFGRIPRVHYEADYRARLWFGDTVDIAFGVAAIGRTSIDYAFEVRRGDEVAVVGAMVAVSFDPDGGGSAPWPDDVRTAFTTGGVLAPERFTSAVDPA
ncbi:MAG TPA: acyl-CoA thioesterase [Mycobacteriales bacterium]|nr:acyl-CoA thioesterase [Mycobacteriales bacterium]